MPAYATQSERHEEDIDVQSARPQRTVQTTEDPVESTRRQAESLNGKKVGGMDDRGQKENVLSAFFDEMQQVATELAPRFAAFGLRLRPELILATALQEADPKDPLNAKSFDNGLGIMQVTPYRGKLDDDVAAAIGWDNSRDVPWNVSHSNWRNALANIRAGGLTMLGKARSLSAMVPSMWSQMDEPHRWRAVVFAYNSGESTAAEALRAGGPDGPMISRYKDDHGVWQSHDYTQELQDNFNYVESHDPFKDGATGTGPTTGTSPASGNPATAPAGAVVPAVDLTVGDQGPEVDKLQRALIQLGFLSRDDYSTGPGTFGPHTRAALMAFQQLYGLPITGFYGPISREALTSTLASGSTAPGTGGPEGQGESGQHSEPNPGSSSPSAGSAPQNGLPASPSAGSAPQSGLPGGALQPGAQGADVQRLQQTLVALGYLTQADMNTGPGIYGPHTTAAVRAFQADWNLPQTGEYDDTTRDLMGKAIAGAPKPVKPAPPADASGVTIPGADAAVAWARAQHYGSNRYGENGTWADWCLSLVNQAYQAAGRTISKLGARTAADCYEAYLQERAVHPKDESPAPYGALVFFTWETEGHIGISMGDGTYIGTISPGGGVEIRTYHVGSYLGWAAP